MNNKQVACSGRIALAVVVILVSFCRLEAQNVILDGTSVVRIENLPVPDEFGEVTVYDVEFLDAAGSVIYGEPLEFDLNEEDAILGMTAILSTLNAEVPIPDRAGPGASRLFYIGGDEENDVILATGSEFLADAWGPCENGCVGGVTAIPPGVTKTWAKFLPPAGSPGADFAADVTSGIVPLTVTFTNNSINANSYDWDFGDSNTSTEENPSHTYTSAGTYTVTLTATGDSTSDTETKTDYITVTTGILPVAAFEADVTTGFAPLTVTFTNQSTDSTSYAWDFGDSNTSTVENPSHTYASAGTYTVTLTATGDSGSDTMTKTDYIVATEALAAGFSADLTVGPVPHTVNFENLSTGATSYSWDFGDGNTSIEVNPTHTYTEIGAYTVSLSATGDEGTDTETLPGYIDVIPEPTTILVNPGPIGQESQGFNFSVNSELAVVDILWTDNKTLTWEAGTHVFIFSGNANHFYTGILLDASGRGIPGSEFVGKMPKPGDFAFGAIDLPEATVFSGMRFFADFEPSLAFSLNWNSADRPLVGEAEPEAPTLTIMVSAPGEATIDWSPDTAGFILQTSADLGTPNWTNAESGSNHPVTVDPTEGLLFYRLIQP